ncbi:ATP-dependent helicase [Fulvivirga kasyanovii]|uniref:DNA 3'-5' helicase n=1 Tax=Fulvivirga kasyanovii TaxID=396812 RepID=A0ABW9RZV8_9BACT|nr:ATP-dependent helicase [Fulvivirga kasyanovii]MTI28954.1 ATP-dependent helicase [Fulvivirga kasyanovii]
MFEWDPKDLNSQQEAAITEKGNVLLVACPGSGKTRTLTYKLAYELSKINGAKKYVIAITYTHRAADEIKERVQLLGVNTRQLWIGTIHSFCLEWIIKPYSLYIEDLKTGYKVISSHDSEVIISELCNKYTSPQITFFDCDYRATPTRLVITCSDSRKRKSVIAVLNEYRQILKKNRQIDFELILHYSFKILRNKPIVRQTLSNLFAYILVDEYQDTKEIQYHIISMVLKASKGQTSALIVGDPNQSIFDSLGGYPIEKTALESLTGTEFILMHLSKNYRSSSVLIEYFDFFKTFPNTIEAEGEHKNYKSIVSFNDTINRDQLENEMVRLLELNINDYGIAPNEICIIAPWWTHLADLTRRLMIRLPDYSFDGPGMAPFSRDIDNFWFKVSKIVLTEPSPVLYVRRLRWSGEVIDDLVTAGVDIDGLSPKRFLRLCNSIELQEEKGLEYLRQFFDILLCELAINIEAHLQLKEHYNSFFASSEARIARLTKDGHEFIGNIENFRKVFKQREGITISTIHGIKGAEYDTVISFALLEDYVPHFSDRNGRSNAKKMLYVIASRARKNLHLISERGRLYPYGSPPNEYLPTLELVRYEYNYTKI